MSSLVPTPSMVFPRVAAWLENPWPLAEHNPVRIEESIKDGKYVVRAELPGFDPEKNIAVTAHEGVLRISAEGEETKKDNGRSEFYYGSFLRSVSLPAGADASKVSAKYVDGILEIS
ncbi:MAG: Hsp20/alpha crystallin family protein, partial [Mycobacteriaceae bacterium]